MSRLDPYSYADSSQPRVAHLTWSADVRFDQRVLACEALLRLDEAGAGPLDLDTKDLVILEVSTGEGELLAFSRGPDDPLLGSWLRVHLPDGTRRIRIRYRTTPTAIALHWLDAAQTATGRPFLYSLCQPIFARSLVPIQDTPTARLSFDARLRVPSKLRPLMAAEQIKWRQSTDATFADFRMQVPIPPYLIALAVGDLHARDIGPRSRVWAERPLLECAAREFVETDWMLAAAEKLFGPYAWGRYDLLVLPSSFPFGGMENPSLAFVAPSVLAGDHSLTTTVIHELAHAWMGNVVTGASTEHIWLNEGFSTYGERRIVEELYGAEVAALHWAVGYRKLRRTLDQHDRLGATAFSRLRLQLSGVNPVLAASAVPYEKGALFLRCLEEAVGRQAFDGFVTAYLARFRFGALSTEEFLAFLKQALPATQALDTESWVYGSGLPGTARGVVSTRLEAIEELAGTLPPAGLAMRWAPLEWQVYLESLPPQLAVTLLAELDRRFGVGHTNNQQVLQTWLVVAARSGYEPALRCVEDFVGTTGRLEYLRPLYRALAEQEATQEWARDLYRRHSVRYHPLVRQALEHVLA